MLREEFASQAHEQWAHWMNYLFKVSKENKDGSVTIPKDKVERWKRQMITSFYNLSEQEQKSDYDQADKFLKLLDEGTYEAKLWKENGQVRHIQANGLSALKDKCQAALKDNSVVVIEVNQVKTLGYLKYPILKEEDLLK